MDEAYQDLLNTLNKLKHVKTRKELEDIQAEIKVKRERALQESEEYQFMVRTKELKAEKAARHLKKEVDNITRQAKRDAIFRVPAMSKNIHVRNVSDGQVRKRLQDVMGLIV